VRFSDKGKDKMGRMKITNLALTIPFDSSDGKSIMENLVRGVAKVSAGDKRKPDERPDDEGLKRDGERIKRQKLHGIGLLGLAPLEGVASGSRIDGEDENPFDAMEE
jgi:hypothetical protein